MDNINYIIAQILGVLTAVLMAISMQAKKPKTLLLLNTLASTANALGYLLLNAYAGFIMNAICVIRNFVYSSEKPVFKKKFWPIMFASAGVVLNVLFKCIESGGITGIISMDGLKSLLPITAGVLGTVYLSFNDNQRIRKAMLVISPLNITYDLLVGAYTVIINEVMCIVSSITGLIRFNKQAKEDEKTEIQQ